MKRVAVAYSGGLDSTVLLYYLAKERGPENVVAVLVDYGALALGPAYDHLMRHTQILGTSYRLSGVSLPSEIKSKARAFSYNPDRDLTRVDSALVPESEVTKAVLKDYAPGLYTVVWAVLGAAAIAEGCKEVALGFHAVPSNVGIFRAALDYLAGNGLLDASEGFMEEFNRLRYIIWGPDAPRMIAPLRAFQKEQVVELGRRLKVPFELTNSCDLWPPCKVCHECLVRDAALST